MINLRLILAAAVSVLTTGCATVFGYSANPIVATVVDADTKQPVSGAVVVVAMPPPRRPNSQTIDSVWNNYAIELAKDTGNKSLYNMRLGNFARLRVVFDSDDCQWKQTPNAVRAFEAEREKQAAYGVKFRSISPLDHLLSDSRCQPMDKFLEAYRR